MAKAKVKVYHKKGANYELDGSTLASDLNGLGIRAGILDDPKIAEYAAHNEFGTDKIPSYALHLQRIAKAT